MLKRMLPVFVIALVAHVVYSQVDKCGKSFPDKAITERCREETTCHTCIAAHPCCAWCTMKDFGHQRCDHVAAIEKSCGGSYMFPTNKFRKIIDKELISGKYAEDAIQISPQKVAIELRPNAPTSFSIKYKQAGDYPLDLYFLMDLTHSMEDDKEKLARLADTLAETMKGITSKFQIGFGSFVEKVALPFVNTHPQWLNRSCQGRCVLPYSYYNQMGLSTDTKRFKEEVSRAQISGNKDSPEATLDALMQAVVCKDDINWRENSRKLLLIATDEIYHVAGDGKLAGIVRPNDGKCHLNATGFYAKGTHQDYPSISQIRKVITKHKINVIFAVTKGIVSAYESLSRRLSSTTVGVLSDDSSNIVELIQNQYNKITSKVKLVHEASDPVKVTFYSSCLGEIKRQTDECEDISISGSVTFETKVEISRCPKDRNDWNQTFHIFPFGINQPITVDLRMLCECDCEKPWNKENSSDHCSRHGTYECGICNCDKNRMGQICQCEATNSGMTDIEDTSACFRPNDTLECSGKGRCVCGRCECFLHENPDEATTGKFCECDNLSCDQHNRLICGGPDRGTCECGVCKCLPGWKGSACECQDFVETCIGPDDTEVCSEHGVCECGKCVCKQTDKEYYTGEFCEKCVVCPGSCEKFKPCVQCKVFKSGPLKKEECDNCVGNYATVKELEEDRNKCYYEDEEGCRYVFTYKMESDNSITLEVKEDKECPKPVNAVSVVLGVTGGIVAVGLLTLLIWRLLAYMHDSAEYVRFKRERCLASWKVGQNPLFKYATSSYQNPSFERGDRYL